MNKKNIIIIIISLVLSILAIFGTLYTIYFNTTNFDNTNTVSYNEYSFSYPKQVEIEENIVNAGVSFKQYKIRNSTILGPNASSISLSLPLLDREEPIKLSDSIRKEFLSYIKPIMINGHDGEIATYHLDEQLPGDHHVEGQTTDIHLQSKYPNAPVMLYYFRGDADPSLDDAWVMLLETLEF